VGGSRGWADEGRCVVKAQDQLFGGKGRGWQINNSAAAAAAVAVQGEMV
jgi:hypothetical protein